MIIAKFIVFLLIMSLVYSGMHYYSYARIRNDFGIGRQRAVFLTVFYCISGLSYFIGRMIQSKYGVGFVLAYGEIWMGVMSISVAVFVLRDLLSIFLKGKAKTLTAIAVAVTLILSLAAFINAKHTAVRNIKLFSPHFTGEEEYRIAAFSDIHLEDNKSPVWLENLVAKVNSLEPDIIVIAGDFCDGALEAKKKLFIDALGKLSASDGVFAVTGNHEFYSGVKQFERFAEKAGIRMLRNESVSIKGKMILAGVDDDAGDAELAKALPENAGGLPVILLSHRPEIFGKAAERGVFLQFSGHTHAGQIPFFNLLVKLYYKHPYGLYRQGDSYIYTTSGAGTWGPPMRLGSKSEIVIFTIVNTVDNNG
ncbi:MAG: metallophosphoesterase [Elusimicrobiota bacterium]|nr:metallophosphoesterase [Elusimicrobiota bacterium]